MLTRKATEDLVKTIKKAYSDYPDNEATTDLLIEQGIRSAYIRGVNDSEKDVEAFTLEDKIEQLAKEREYGTIHWNNIIVRASNGDPMAQALMSAVMVYSRV